MQGRCVVVVFLLALVLDPALSVPRVASDGAPVAPENQAGELSRLLLADAAAAVCAHANNTLALCDKNTLSRLPAGFLNSHLGVLMAARLWHAAHTPQGEAVAKCVALHTTPAASTARASPMDAVAEAARVLRACAMAPQRESDEGVGPTGAVSLLQVRVTTGGLLESAAFTSIVLIVVFLVSAAVLFFYSKHMAKWSFPPFGLGTSDQTSAKVISVWIGMVSTFMAIFLALIIKFYSVSRAAYNRGQFHAPFQSVISTDEALDMMGPYNEQNSLSTFLTGEQSKAYFLDREFDPDKPLTFAEWMDPVLDHDKPDPLRVLVKVYFVDKRAQSALNAEGEKVDIDNVSRLLKQVYQWRKLWWKVQSVVTQIDLTPAGSERTELKNQRAELLATARAEREGLMKALHPAWRNLHRHLTFVSTSQTVQDNLDSTQSWASTLLAMGMIVDSLYSFLDRSPQCPLLLNEDNTIKQGLTRLSEDGSTTARLPTIHNARTWTCSHMNTKLTEEGTVCMLSCNRGFHSEMGTTLCDSLGGGGMAWTHLESGLLDRTQLGMPSCCISSPEATNLNEDFVANATAADTVEFAWTNEVGFAFACGVEQTLVAQVCVYSPSDVVAGTSPHSVCNAQCPTPDKASPKCVSTTKSDLVPTELWTAMDGRSEDEAIAAAAQANTTAAEFAGLRASKLPKGLSDYRKFMELGVSEFSPGARIATLSVTVPTGSKALARMAMKNVNGLVVGPWKEVVQA